MPSRSPRDPTAGRQPIARGIGPVSSCQWWESIHVQDVGLETADDRFIWQYALERNLTIVTKDEDFQALANRQGGIPPQVVWVRLGNCRKPALLEAFSRILPALRESLDAGDAVVEIR